MEIAEQSKATADLLWSELVATECTDTRLYPSSAEAN